MQLFERKTLMERMMQSVRAQTDAITYFGPGPFRAFLYAVASEIQHLYYKLFKVEQRLDVLSATDTALDNYGQGRGLTRLGASYSSALVTLEASAIIAGTGQVTTTGTTVTGVGAAFNTQIVAGDVLIVGTINSTNRGTVLTTPITTANGPIIVDTPLGDLTTQNYWIQKASITVPVAPTPLQLSTFGGLTFQAVEDVTLRPTSSLGTTLRGIVQVRSLGTGFAQNVAANSIRNIVNPAVIPLVTAQATNPAASQGGADQESDPVFRSRIMTLYAGLNQGTAAFYEAQVRTINPSVVRIFLARGPSLNEVLVYCLTSDGSALDPSEKLDLQEGLAAVVPVQTRVTIRDMLLQPIDVSFTTSLSGGATVTSVADELANSYRQLLDWSTWPYNTAVQADDLLRIASATNGVNSLNLSTFSPLQDVEMPAATLPRVGTITVQDASTGASTVVTDVLQLYPRLT